MKKHIRVTIAFFCIVSNFCFGSQYKTPDHLFVNGGQVDFEKIYLSNVTLLKASVQLLFDEDKLNHEQSKAYDQNAVFEAYWKVNSYAWHLVDLNHDGELELFYNNHLANSEYATFELYVKNAGKYQALYFETGVLIAYKIQPNTNEIILYRHQFPCCTNLSHNIESIRLLHGKITKRKRFFIARPDNMKTKLFPLTVNYPVKYSYLTKETIVRWSAEKVSKNAAPNSAENIVARYLKDTPYRVLSVEDGWYYVLLCGEPKNEQNPVMNTANFGLVHVYGWIKK